VSFTEAENASPQRLLSHGTLTEKCLPYFSGPKSCHQLMTFSTGIGPKRDPETGPSFFNFFELFLLQNLTFLNAARHHT